MRIPTPIFLLTLLAFSTASFKVYKLKTKTESENTFLRSLESNPDYDFWSRINKVGKTVTVMVAPKSQKVFEHFLETNKINFNIEDAEALLQTKVYGRRAVSNSNNFTFDRYWTHDEMNAYMAQLAQNYPNTVTVENIGSGDSQKPAIFIDGGIHAREWISPAVALYTIHQLVENPENIDLIQDVEWIILPSLNPDGYEYTWEDNTFEHRLWRKTLSKGERCDGCDANRNFGFHWMEDGADDEECSEVYAGKYAFSEVETKSVAEFLNSTENVAAYLTLHSYGEYLVYPWGYADILCDNWEELDGLAHAMGDAISAASTRGSNYTIGETTATIYAAAGGSADWAMGVAGIDIAYSMELPGGGWYGFDLPETEIESVVTETFEGFRVLATYVAKNRR